MTWIRNPWWDGLFIWSGVPIGIVLMLTCPGMVPALAVAVMVLETAHIVSPTILAWSTPGLRAILLREWRAHVAAPLVIMAGSFVAPIAWVFPIYWTWNIYHFGMQWFGVASLYGIGKDRTLRGVACLGLTALGMGVLPLVWPDPHLALLCTGIFSFNHWLVDIGLSSRVVRWHWGFIALVLAIGVVWLLLRNGPLSAWLVPQILVVRMGLGICHFIDSARIWRLSDLQVRATIRGALFATVS
jgi:hypothetical protein